MSVSPKLSRAFQVQKALGRPATTADSSQLNGYNIKSVTVLCRKCQGSGICPEGNCPQCGGRGVEKLSMKTISKLAKTLPRREKLADTFTESGMSTNFRDELLDKFLGGHSA